MRSMRSTARRVRRPLVALVVLVLVLVIGYVARGCDSTGSDSSLRHATANVRAAHWTGAFRAAAR